MTKRRIVTLSLLSVAVVGAYLTFKPSSSPVPTAHAQNAAPPAEPVKGDWPTWGGNNTRNMVSGEKGLNWDIDPGKKIKGKDEIDMATTKGLKWTVKLGSQSYGTPVVSQGRVLVGTNNENAIDSRIKNDRGVVLCLDEKDGRVIWQFASPKIGTGKVSDWEYLGMCNTGEIEGNRVYLNTNRCEIVCLDLDGMKNGNDGPFTDEAQYLSDKDTQITQTGDLDADIIWTFDMRSECGVFPHNITSSCVMVLGDRVYANTSNGQDWTHTNIPAPKAPNLVAVDKKTGQIVGEEASGISKRCLHGSWSSPAYVKINGEDQIIFGASDGYCYGFSPKTKPNEEGIEVFEELWRIECNDPSYRKDENGKPRKYQDFNGPSEIIATPVVYDGKVYVAIGQDPEHQEGVGMLSCIDPTMRGDISGKAVWQYKDVTRTIGTPAVADGIIYVADFSGRLHAVDITNGKQIWMYDTKGQIWASPLVVDGHVLAANAEGELHILKAGRTKELVKKLNFNQPIYASPVAANGCLYITTMSRLYVFGKK